MIFLDDLCQQESMFQKLTEGARKMVVHPDVIELAGAIVHDEAKLKAAAPYIFFPAYDTWLEWRDERGKIGMYFHGPGESVTDGQGIMTMQDHGDPESGVLIPLQFHLPQYDVKALPSPTTPLATRIQFEEAAGKLKPIVYAILAMINSPKLIRTTPVDVSRINKRREALGRYSFHPHHEVRLDIDKRIIKTTAGHGDGASKCLHFVRTHLRLVQGQYILVRPHWRGDPALGIRDTHYRVDRKNSKWPG